ncbi:unnamed protein product [Adineta steineri]|uniref:G-protein coupled receptors family 1 profile domain-containing protein n=1 Tax=Adineta steineri TaxID=433720 RepID=A0A814H3E4_9BILA|nr:unnamed protein product [Adineta steineri]CAF1104616.1 unnamed protein product [Adineta steineri]
MSYIDQLNTAASVTAITLSLISWVPGVIGLVLNVFIFTRPALRHEPCSLYFLTSSYFNLFVIFIILPVRTVTSSLNMDLGNYNIVICKMESYIFYVVRVISCWLIMLACFDRFLHSSTNIRKRQLSSLKTARLTIVITIISIIILYSHMVIYYKITDDVNTLGNITPTCNAPKGIYRTFIAMWHMTFYSLCPSCLMLVFGYLTLNNIRQQRQVLPITGVNNQIHRRTDRYLLRMLTAQVLVIIISTLPFSIYRVYSSFTVNIAKSTFRIAQENLAVQIANTVPYFAHSSSFYLYTLTGSVFRKEACKIIPCCSPHRRNRVHMSHNQRNQISVVQIDR